MTDLPDKSDPLPAAEQPGPASSNWRDKSKLSRRNIIIFGIVFALIGTVTLLAALAAPRSNLWEEYGSGSKVINENARQIIELNMSWQAGGSLTANSAVIKNGFAPTMTGPTTHVAEIRNQSGKLLATQSFAVNPIVADPPPLAHGRAKKFYKPSTYDFSVTLAFVPGAASAIIKDSGGNQLAKFNLRGAARPENSIRFRSSKGGDLAKKQPVSLLRSLFSAAKANAQSSTDGYLDITFIGDSYSQSQNERFIADVQSLSKNLLAYEPFKSRASQIRFNYVLNYSSLGCAYSGRLLVCNDSLVTQALNSAGAKYDKAVVIVNNDTYGGSGGSIAVGYNGQWKNEMFAHEFGHSLGGLTDEYNLYEYNGSLSNKVIQNCYAGNPPAAEWTYVPLVDYRQGCNYQNYFRSSPSSIMLVLDSKYYNEASQRIINNQITAFTGTGGAIDSTKPTAAITGPQSGAVLLGTVTVSAEVKDNVGVTKVELYLNNSLYSALYSAPYNFNLATTTITNGTYSLSVRGYDAAGNVGVSSPVSVSINNAGNDNTAPAISIVSPASGSTVSGDVTIKANASDNSGTIAFYEYFIDDQLLLRTTANSLLWNSASVSSGSHTIKVNATDPSGNKASAQVGISTKNTVDSTGPQITIVSPAANQTLTSSTHVITVSASDSSGVASLQILIDGAVVKTCSYVTSCSYKLQLRKLTRGSHTLSVKATDNSAAKNSSTSSLTFTNGS